MPRASVVFNADTGQYVAAVQGMDAATAKTAEAVAAAKNRILDSYKAQEQELKKAGASAEDYATAYKNTSNTLVSVTEKNADRQVEALDRVFSKQRQLKAEMAALGAAPESGAGHGFSDRMAASTVVRAGEGTTSIRAVESVLTMIPGATVAAQGLATVIGGAGLIAVLGELGEKGYEAFTKLRDATQEATRAAEEANDKDRIAIDDKELLNQKLQDQIDKLSGHPNNGLATALLEVKKNADDALNSLRAVFKQEDEIFGQQKRGMLQNAENALLNVGPEGTEQQRKELREANQTVVSTVSGFRNNLDANLSHATNDDDKKAATDQYNQAVHDSVQSRIDTLKREYKRLGDEEAQSRQEAAIAESQGVDPGHVKDNSLKQRNIQTNIDDLERYERAQTLDDSIYKKQTTLGTIKQDKQLNKSGEDEARKAAEEQRKQWEDEIAKAQMPVDLSTGMPKDVATPRQVYDIRVQQQQSALPLNKVDAEKNTYQAYEQWLRTSTESAKQIRDKADKDERQQWSDQLEAQRAAGPMSAQAEADYWNLVMLTADTGSKNYLEAERNFNVAMVKVREERDRAGEASKRAGLQTANDQARIQESTVALEEQTGQISKYDAAVQLANIHSQQYATQIAALRAELERQQGIDAAAGRDTPSAETIKAQEDVARASADRVLQVQQDAARAAAETWMGALTEANDQWVQNATDSAAQVKQLYSQVVDGFNDQAATAITGGKTDWSGYLRGVGKTVATDGLKQGESALMGAFGLGKPDGSSANPLYVKMADGMASVGGGANSALGGLLKLFGGGGGATGADGAGAAGSEAASGVADQALGGFADAISMGGFALGGDIAPSPQARTITVGEMGPEPITLGPGTSAHITPAKDAGGGQNITHNWNIGQGVTPEQTKMYVKNALDDYHKRVMPAGAVAAVQNHNSRATSARRT